MVSLVTLDMELGGAEFNVDFLQVDQCRLRDPVANINADQMESVVFSVMMEVQPEERFMIEKVGLIVMKRIFIFVEILRLLPRRQPPRQQQLRFRVQMVILRKILFVSRINVFARMEVQLLEKCVQMMGKFTVRLVQ